MTMNDRRFSIAQIGIQVKHFGVFMAVWQMKRDFFD